jgi:hypothetical protein
MVTLPAGCGMPLIDGNRRAARALRDGSDFLRRCSTKPRHWSCLRRRMGKANSDAYWKRMLASKPHTMDK